MVLSNKKLKQKVRDLALESAALGESKNGANKVQEVNQELEKLKEILLTNKIKRPRPPRRKNQPLESEGPGTVENEDVESGKTDGGLGDVESENKSGKKVGGDGDVESEKTDGGHGVVESEKKSGKNRKKNKKMKEKKKIKKKEKKAEKEKNGEDEGSDTVKDNINGNGGGGVDDKKSIEETKIEEREVKNDFATKIYVGGMPYYSTEDDIRSFFESCGTIIEIDCMKFPESGKFRGIAFLTFKTEAAAKRALELDGADMGGLYLKIKPYKPSRSVIKSEKEDFAPQILEGYNRIYAGNLSWDITEDDLRKLFSDCNIVSVRFGEDKESGEFKGYAHVDFSDSVSLGIALKLDRKVVCGRPVRIRCAVPLIKEKGANSGQQKDGEPNVIKRDGNAGSNSKPVAINSETDGIGNGKKRKRTCYECGNPGHISTDCPKKKIIDNGSSAGANTLENNENIVAFNSDAVTSIDEENKKKKKRQTCYECGVPGHLSSKCPEKKTADISNHDESNTVKYQETGYNKNGVSSYSEQVISPVEGKKKKKKRQTCYECGVPGHLSSDCPQKKTASAV